MLRDVFEICAAYIQSLMLLFQITSAAFPKFFTSPVDILQYVNLDLLNQFDESSRYRNTLNITIPRWVPLDFRLQFAIIAVIGPLFLSIVGMFFLGTKLFFVWFMLLLGGAFVLIISAASKINENLVRQTIITQNAVSIAFNVGLAVTLTMVVCGLAVYVWRTLMQSEIVDQEKQQLAQVVDADMQDRDAEIEMQLGRQETNDGIGSGAGSDPSSPNSPNSQSESGGGVVSRKERLDHIMQLETSELDVVATVTRAVYFAVFFVAGLIFAHVIPFDAFKDNNVFYALSGVVFFFAICLLIWCMIGLFRGGREFQFSAGVWVRDNFVSMLLLLVSVVYTPAVTDIISLYSCAQVTCAAGYHLPVSLSVMASSTRATYSETKGSSACFSCNFTAFNAQQCPASLQDSLCGNATSDSRLTA
ncbi:membrane-associated protein, putative, partial [Bodo saltans]